MSTFASQIYLPVLLVVLLILSQSIKMVNEYERVVIFRLGRLSGVKGPGIFLIIPIVDRAMKIDLRITTMNVPKQAVITRDNVTVEVDAVVYYKVVEPGAAITQVENYSFATVTLSQTILRDVVGHMELDGLLSEREHINKQIQELLDTYTEPWGIKVTGVTIMDVALPDTMKRAIAKQAEAEREKRSRIILAEGEFQAAQKMKDAASLYEGIPAAIKLRELQTLADIAREKNLIVVTQAQSLETGNIAALSQGITEKKGQ
ncbi:MAG: slipin family protein [Methanosarcina sp.]|nr:slipin family protein [Methanosarcina sp.]MDD3873001.1 slipin family protein [Methanosarcina sp.]MDD4522649.1 slipin family protein [Methanosarcina sp.]HHV25138.1 slipin family protein [Methanosarcina sp.]